MKKMVFLILIFALCLSFSGCSQPDPFDHLFDDLDPETLEEAREGFNSWTAEENGDTYCSRCNKFIEGTVRICPYCGQYID